MYNWGERERAPPLMMSTALASVRPFLRPRTSRRLRMRDIHVIYADSNSADFAGFKNRLLCQCKQQERDRQTRLERRRQQERERRGINCTIRTKRVTTSGSPAGYIHSTTVLCDKYSLPIVRIKCKERAWNQPTGVCVGKRIAQSERDSANRGRAKRVRVRGGDRAFTVNRTGDSPFCDCDCP